MEPKESIHSEKQIYARIQYFYDLMLEKRHHLSNYLDPSEIVFENELDKLMEEFFKIFGDIIYVQ